MGEKCKKHFFIYLRYYKQIYKKRQFLIIFTYYIKNLKYIKFSESTRLHTFKMIYMEKIKVITKINNNY